MSNFNKMFNSVTITGRANVAKATYASFALLYIMHRLRKRSKAAAKCPDCGCQNCASDSGTSPPAAAGKTATEGTCDPEIWKRALSEEKSATSTQADVNIKENTVSAVQLAATRSDDIGGEERVKGISLDTDSQNAKKVNLREQEPSVVNSVWGCDI